MSGYAQHPGLETLRKRCVVWRLFMIELHFARISLLDRNMLNGQAALRFFGALSPSFKNIYIH